MKLNMGSEPERSRAVILACIAVVSVLIATLYPFNPYPRNRVTWLKGSNGLKFDRPGLALSDQRLNFASADGSSYSVELFVRPISLVSASTIVGFYSPHATKQLLIGQYYGSGLMITHVPGIESDETATIEVDVAHIFRPQVQVLISISSGPNGTTVFIDGDERAHFQRFTISQEEVASRIVLGTSPVAYDPWQGELRGLVIYAKELTSADALRHFKEWVDSPGKVPDLRNAIAGYSFAEGAGNQVRNEVGLEPDLRIPSIFFVPYKSFLQTPVKEFKADGSYVRDILTNIAGFVPLGLILCAFFTWTSNRWKAIFTAAVACGALSLVIEILQYCIPRRGSGLTDVITNTLGGVMGALLMQSGVVRHLLRRMGVIRCTYITG